MRLDALADHAAVELDLRFARAAARADAAALALQVGPAPHQPRRQVLQPRQLDLQLAFVALRALARRSRGSASCGRRPATPRWRSRLRCCAGDSAWSNSTASAWCSCDQRLDLVGLAGADEQRRVGRLAARDDARDRRRRRPTRPAGASSSSEASKCGTPPKSTPTRIARAGPVVGASGRAAQRKGRPAAAARVRRGSRLLVGSAAWKLTARPGTTVEIACL